MGILDFIKRELIEIIEWTDDSRDVLSHRFEDEDKAIKRGAQLIVRESQVAQFLYLGEFGDTFGPGKHTLTTDNIPVLTTLKSWKYGFESPFKADVYFVNTRLFTGNKWGTSNPIMMHDEDFGVVRARAFGTYDFRIVDPKTFIKEVAGSDHEFLVDEFSDAMRSRVVSVFGDALASSGIPVVGAAKKFTELGDALLPLINSATQVKYGLEITSFIVENISLPPDVEKAIDQRTSMTAIGDLNGYLKLQLGKGLETGGGGSGGMATELAVGLAIAQQMMKQGGAMTGPDPAPAGAFEAGGAGAAGAGGATGGAGAAAGGAGAAGATAGAEPVSDLLTPDQVARTLGVTIEDVMAVIESGELKAKKIGSAYRVKRSALQEYLSS